MLPRTHWWSPSPSRNRHRASSRAHNPLVVINCAAIPPNLIESELFGYEKGAFTDAKTRKHGLLEQADGGAAEIYKTPVRILPFPFCDRSPEGQGS